MASPTNALCPSGTWCVNPSTAIAVVIIFLLCTYIGVTHWRAHQGSPPATHVTPNNTTPPTATHVPTRTAPHLQQHQQHTSITTADNKWEIPVTHSKEPTPQHTSNPVVATITNIYSSHTTTIPNEVNMLRPPLRGSPNTTTVGLMPINIKTRGETPDMQQVGILRSKNNDKVLALYGRPTYRGSSKWMYYTGTDKYHSIKLPVEKNKRDCTAEYGCDELYDDDEVNVKGYNDVFQTSIYQLDAPRYIPFVV